MAGIMSLNAVIEAISKALKAPINSSRSHGINNFPGTHMAQFEQAKHCPLFSPRSLARNVNIYFYCFIFFRRGNSIHRVAEFIGSFEEFSSQLNEYST
jgi:hypothetical protein